MDTFWNRTLSLFTQVYKMGTGDILPGVTLHRLASHPGGSSNTLSCFMLQKPGQAPAVWASLARVRLNLLPHVHHNSPTSHISTSHTDVNSVWD